MQNAVIVAVAVLGTFSVVLRAFGGFLGLIFPVLWGLLGAFGGFHDPLGGFLGPPRCSRGPLGTSPGALWCGFELPNRPPELLRQPVRFPRSSRRRFGNSPGALRCDLVEKEPPSVKQIQARYWSLVFSSHWSLVARHSSLFTRL